MDGCSCHNASIDGRVVRSLLEDGQLRAGGFVAQHNGVSRKPKLQALSMIDQVGEAIAKTENGNFAAGTTRHRRLALAALEPLTRPTEAMVDGAHEAVWFDAYWAINNRRDFTRAVRAMITAAINGG